MMASDFAKMHKKIIKGTLDPSAIETKTCVAKVRKFSDDYETIRLHLSQYCDTGSLKTPNHGRGKRILRTNGRYTNSDDEDEQPSENIQDTQEKPPKRPRNGKKSTVKSVESSSRNEMEALKAKYKLSTRKPVDYVMDRLSESDKKEDEASCELEVEDEIVTLRKENGNLRQKLKAKEKENEHLKSVISNLKVMPCLTDIVADLQEQVTRLTNGQAYSGQDCSTPLRSSFSSTTPSRHSSGASTPIQSSDSDVETQLVRLCPNVDLTKGQHGAIKSKTNLNDFVYAIMGMLWSREIMCTHSISGKASNAFKEKDAKPQLDPEKVKSILEYGAKRFGCKETEVRQVMAARMNNVVKVEKAKKKG